MAKKSKLSKVGKPHSAKTDKKISKLLKSLREVAENHEEAARLDQLALHQAAQENSDCWRSYSASSSVHHFVAVEIRALLGESK